MKKYFLIYLFAPALLFSQSLQNGQISNYRGLAAWFLPGYSSTIDSAKLIKQCKDMSLNLNNATQTTPSLMPADSGSSGYYKYKPSSLVVTNNSSLNINNNLTMYTQISTTASTAFMTLGAQNYAGGFPNKGWAMFTDASKLKSEAWCNLSKTSISATGTTTINNGVTHKIYSTVNCSRSWNNYSSSISIGEEPNIWKENGNYYLIYDSVMPTGAWTVRMKVSPSYLFDKSLSYYKLIPSGYTYTGFWKDGSTYRLLACDSVQHNIYLFTSSTITGNYVNQGILLTYGAAYDAFLVADPSEIKIGSTYYLYYSGFSALSTGTVCYATSSTGLPGSYTKNGTAIGNGSTGSFDLNLCADPEIYLTADGTTYVLFYTGYNSSLSKQQQGYATSTNGSTWTKFSGNPIHYWIGASYEAGSYGPNEPSMLYEPGAGPGGTDIWRMYYRSDNQTMPFKIGYSEYYADMTDAKRLPICGNEKTIMNLYVDGNLDATNTLTGANGSEYIPAPTQNTYIGGNNTNTIYFSGNLYDCRIFNAIKINF